MHACAARRRVESLDRLVHRLGTEPVLVIGPGRTDRLRAQQPAAAGHLFRLRRPAAPEESASSSRAVPASRASRRASVTAAPGASPAGAMPAISRLGRRMRLPSARAYEMSRPVRPATGMRPLRKSSSTGALACAAPAARSSSAGNSGLGRGGGGQRSSFMPSPQGRRNSRPGALKGRQAPESAAGRAFPAGRCAAGTAATGRRIASPGDSFPSRSSNRPAIGDLGKRPLRLKLVAGQRAIPGQPRPSGPCGKRRSRRLGATCSRDTRHRVDQSVQRRHRLRARWRLVFGQAPGQPDRGRQGGENRADRGAARRQGRRGRRPRPPPPTNPASNNSADRRPCSTLVRPLPKASRSRATDQQQVGEPAAERS